MTETLKPCPLYGCILVNRAAQGDDIVWGHPTGDEGCLLFDLELYDDDDCAAWNTRQPVADEVEAMFNAACGMPWRERYPDSNLAEAIGFNIPLSLRAPVAGEAMVERIVMAMREAGDWQWGIVLTGDGGYEFTTRTQEGWLANGAAAIQSLTAQRNAERAKVAELVEGLGELLGETTGAKVGDGDCHTYLTADPPSARMLIKARALIERMKP